MNRAIILTTQSGDWEGLFIDGKLIDEGHEIGEGERFFILSIAEEYNLKATDFKIFELSDEDDLEIAEQGNFPQNLSDLKYYGYN